VLKGEGKSADLELLKTIKQVIRELAREEALGAR